MLLCLDLALAPLGDARKEKCSTGYKQQQQTFWVNILSQVLTPVSSQNYFSKRDNDC